VSILWICSCPFKLQWHDVICGSQASVVTPIFMLMHSREFRGTT
jgi:hypothetical protein